MKSEQLQKWALIAEIVGGVAVLVTLVVIALEIRTNTSVQRADNFAELLSQMNDWRIATVSDPDLIEYPRMINTYRSGSMEIPSLEWRIFSQVMSPLWSIYESAFFYNQYGLLGEAEWRRFEERICLIKETPDAWIDVIRPRLGEEFAIYVDANC
jgi:hypothetical protein